MTEQTQECLVEDSRLEGEIISTVQCQAVPHSGSGMKNTD